MEEKEYSITEVKFTVPTKEYYQVMVTLKEFLNVSNVATALFSAAKMILTLHEYEKQGWKIAAIKDDKMQPLKIPTL